MAIWRWLLLITLVTGGGLLPEDSVRAEEQRVWMKTLKNEQEQKIGRIGRSGRLYWASVGEGATENDLGQIPVNTQSLLIENTSIKDWSRLVKLPAITRLRIRVPDYGNAILEAISKNPRVVSIEGKFSDEGLEFASRMRQLESLTIISSESQTPITPSGLTVLSGNPNLASLSMKRVTDEHILVLTKIPKLTSLTISKSNITDRAIRHLANFPQLRFLDLSGTEISREAFHILASHPSIKEVKVEGQPYTDSQLLELRNITKLKLVWSRHLSVFSMARTGNKAVRLDQFTREIDILDIPTDVEEIDIRHCHVTDWSFLRSLRQLKKLTMNNVAPADAVMHALRNHPRMSEISIWSGGLSDVGLKSIAQIPALHTLKLSYGSFTGLGLSALNGHQRLSSLDLYINKQITDDDILKIKDVPNLTAFRVSTSPVTDRTAKHLTTFPGLKKIDLSQTAATENSINLLREMPHLEELTIIRIDATRDNIAAAAKGAYFRIKWHKNLTGSTPAKRPALSPL